MQDKTHTNKYQHPTPFELALEEALLQILEDPEELALFEEAFGDPDPGDGMAPGASEELLVSWDEVA